MLKADQLAIVPWYADAASYRKIRISSEDQDDFFESFACWREAAMAHESAAGQHGVVLIRIVMVAEAYHQWARESGQPQNESSRMQYSRWRARQLLVLNQD